MTRIEELVDSEIGQYEVKNKKFLAIADKITEIRGEYGPEKYEERTEAMSKFANNGTTVREYMDFQGMYEFILHIHNIYGAKLNKRMLGADD